MKRSSKARELTMEVTVGTFVFAALLSLSFFTILLSSENIFMRSHPFEVVFDDVMGLRDGDSVVIKGMPIGKVKGLKLQDDGVHVLTALRNEVKLRQDYKIEIILTSVLGGRYLQIYAGSAGAPELPPDTVITGRCPHDLITEATAVLADFKDISGKISRGEGTLGKLVNDEGLYTDTREIVGEIKTAMKDRHLMENLEGSVSNLNEVSGKINRGEGTLGMLVNDDGLYTDTREIVGEIKTAIKDRQLLENLAGSVSNLNEISGKINSGEGTLGKLVNDDDLYEESKRVFSDARATLNDLRETAPIVTFTSIFFGVF